MNGQEETTLPIIAIDPGKNGALFENGETEEGIYDREEMLPSTTSFPVQHLKRLIGLKTNHETVKTLESHNLCQIQLAYLD